MIKRDYEDIFGSRGSMVARLSRYEHRSCQVEMAKAIEGAIEDGAHLIVEAGTGVGKSFAYLVPFIEWAAGNNKRVVVSTYTKALQEQLAKKDIPFLEESLGINFRYALCFGGENYLCKRRLDRSWQQGLFETKREAKEFEEIMRWGGETVTGLRMELPFEPLDSVWFRICRESDLCRGKKCSHRNECFYAKAREEQARAHLLIANHHLFFADIASGRQILPKYDAVVFDEAHNLEDVAADHLGFDLTNTQLKYLIDEFHHPKQKTGFLGRLHKLKNKSELIVMANAARQAGDIFFEAALDNLGGKAALSLREPNRIENLLSSTIEQMADAVAEKIEDIQDEEDRDDLETHVLRLRGWAGLLSEFVEQKREGHVYWIESEARPRAIKCHLCASPVDVAPHLKKLVFDEIAPIVLTSATMAVGGTFDFIKRRLGLTGPQEILISSPFDFEKQTLLYTPSDLPDPAREEALHAQSISERIGKLVEITGGRSFVLFTSYKTLDRVHELLIDRLSDFQLLRQGDFPRWQLLKEFKKDGRAVLFGTATFWQGVDVPGSALECVIITRLPFAVPDHPLIEARIADIESRGEDAFMGYQVPKAALLLKQGFGRLIRHRDDVGIVAILDPRIKTRAYGRMFLDSLPQCREMKDIDEVAAAYKEMKSHNVAVE